MTDNICRVTAFAPPDPAKELVTLRKPTVHKVTMRTAAFLLLLPINSDTLNFIIDKMISKMEIVNKGTFPSLC